jgi:hypothetical protein
MAAGANHPVGGVWDWLERIAVPWADHILQPIPTIITIIRSWLDRFPLKQFAS